MGTKIYIMTDMEGISGVREPSQCDRNHLAWQSARRLLVGDVNAAISGAMDGGADEVLVSDGHGGGFNFLLEEMDPRATYERPNGARDYLPGLDETFSGVFQIGAHAMAGTLTYTRQDYADQVARNPGVERVDARTVRKVVQHGIDVLGF